MSCSSRPFAELLDQLFILHQVVVITAPPQPGVANLIKSISDFWENHYAACKIMKPEQSRWLALAAPLLLDLVDRHKDAWLSFKQNLPARSYRLLKAVAATISCLPMTSRASPTQDKYLPMQHWLQQHPQHLAALQAAVSSPGVSWFVWSFTAAYTAKAAGVIGYRTLTDGSPVMADHVALLEYIECELKFTAADKIAICLLRLVFSLSHLHLHLPAEQVLRNMVKIRKQQLGMSGSSSSSSGSEAGGDTDGGSSSSSNYHLSSSSCEGSSTCTSLLHTAACRPGCRAEGGNNVLADGQKLGGAGGGKHGQAAEWDTVDIGAECREGLRGNGAASAHSGAGSEGIAAAGARGGGEAAPGMLPTAETPGASSKTTDVIWLFTVLPSQQVGPSPSDHPADKPRQGAAAAGRASAGSAGARVAPPIVAAAGQGQGPGTLVATSGGVPGALDGGGELGKGEVWQQQQQNRVNKGVLHRGQQQCLVMLQSALIG